ncbi:hypothetical protein QUF70_04595 [Desulfobacterales bacterium HSG17]|nr:hypothetical protein [Desulfobacterales bacterium HSG17]
MNENYYLDLEKYSLQKFKLSLRKRDLIPSRIVLKEKIDERFKMLNINGISNLKILIEVLKTKQKIELFSKKTGLSVEYLKILKREASSYLPNPISLKNFPGIDSKDVKSLEAMKIKLKKKQILVLTK